MIVRAGYRITYDCAQPCPMMLVLSVRPELHGDLLTPEVLQVEPGVTVSRYEDLFGNVVTRVLAPAGPISFSSDFRIRVSDLADPVTPDARQHPVEELPDEALVYLLGSRYCETDRLLGEAWRLFGSTEPGWARVQAIVDYAHERLRFSYPDARPTRTAADAHEERIGVCRDFAHLAVF